MQLDLFLDGRETILVNDLVAALLAGRLEGARDAVNRLRKENPAHPDLEPFERLVRSVCEKPPAPPSPGELGAMIERRSEERRVGKECMVQCRSRWSPYH